MKLLIVTQTVNPADPVLGFFHGWIREFAKHCDSVTVVTQSGDSHGLPSSVRVLSLGKDNGVSRWGQILRFWRIIWTERRNYDRVFVHMTPVWVILGAPVWVPLCRRTHLWYEIKRGSLKFSVAQFFCCKVFAATDHGVPRPLRHLHVVGHGIDTEAFRPGAAERDSRLVTAVGRLTQVKRYDRILDAFSSLSADCRLRIAGDVITDADRTEEQRFLKQAEESGLTTRVEKGWVAPQELPALLQRAALMLHASEGGLDKAVLQAMACGCPVVSVSAAAQAVLPLSCRATAETFAAKARDVLALSAAERHRLSEELRSIVLRDHALGKCIGQIVTLMQ